MSQACQYKDLQVEKLTISPLQDKIITQLKGTWLPTRRLAQLIYGIPRDAQPTRSQAETIRQALRSLEKREFIQLTKFIWDRQRCWELTGKALPLPEKKKTLPKPRLVK